MKNIDSESDMFDSDVTLITNSQENKFTKKKHKILFNNIQNTSEPSQSLLTVMKKKSFHIIGESTSSRCNSPVTKSVFKQPSSVKSEKFTPVKVENEKMTNDNEILSPFRNVKAENTILDGPSVALSKKHKKKKYNGYNSSMISQNGESFTNSCESNNQTSFSSDAKEFDELDNSEVNYIHKKKKKKKKKYQDNETNAFEEKGLKQNDSNDRVTADIDCQFCGTSEIYIKNNSLINRICDKTHDKNNCQTTNCTDGKSGRTKKKKSKHSESFNETIRSNNQQSNSQSVSSDISDSSSYHQNILSLNSPSQSRVDNKKHNHSAAISEGSVSKIDEPPVKIKTKGSIDALTQDIFERSASEEFVNSTPRKVKKKKCREMLPVEKVETDSKSLVRSNDTLSDTIEKDCEVKLSPKSENGNTSFKYNDNSNDSVSQLHTCMDIDEDSKSFGVVKSEITPSKYRKKRNKLKTIEDSKCVRVDEGEISSGEEEKNEYNDSDVANNSFKENRLGQRNNSKEDSETLDNKSGTLRNTKIGDTNGTGFDLDSCDDSDDDTIDRKMSRIDILQSQLKNLTIEVDFDVPRLHKICNRSSQPTPSQRAQISNENIRIRSGKFVKSEDRQIKENWRQFIEKYNFQNVPEVFFSLQKKYISIEEKRNFLFVLSRNLPKRMPVSVFQRFKILMTKMKIGRFTKEEDDYILKQMEETGCRRNYIKEIADHLQRPFTSVEKRIRRLKHRQTRKIKWKRGNLTAFIKYLLKVTHTDPDDINKLKDRHITALEWNKLSKKLDNVPRDTLKRIWLVKIHPTLFVPNDVYDLRDVKLKLIKMFVENKETDWRSVNWSKYAAHFEGLTSLKIFCLIKTLVYSKVPSGKRDKLKKCLKILKKCTEADLSAHVIRKIQYKNREIVQSAASRKNR